jgi:hydroxyacylglutathione hydrolase
MERRVNPYLRFDAPELVALMTREGMPTATRYQRWQGVMALD